MVGTASSELIEKDMRWVDQPLDPSGGGLAEILALAFVPDKLLAEAFLRVGCPLERVQWDLEVPLTVRAGANRRYGGQPLGDS